MAKESVSVSLRMDADLHERLEQQLDYGDSKSDWIREAIEKKLKEESESDQGTYENES